MSEVWVYAKVYPKRWTVEESEQWRAACRTYATKAVPDKPAVAREENGEREILASLSSAAADLYR